MAQMAPNSHPLASPRTMSAQFVDPQTGRLYTIVVRGSETFCCYADAPEVWYSVPREYLQQPWVKIGNLWQVHSPLPDTFRILDGIVALAEDLLPFWDDVFSKHGARVRKTWSYFGAVHGWGDLGNKVYHLAVMCALRVRRHKRLPALHHLQDCYGHWVLNVKKTGDVLEGIMGCAWIANRDNGCLASESFWHKARQHVEIAALGVYQIWNNPLNRDTYNVHEMVNRILGFHVDDMVQIVRYADDVRRHNAPLRQQSALEQIHLNVKLLIIGRNRLFSSSSCLWLPIKVARFFDIVDLAEQMP